MQQIEKQIISVIRRLEQDIPSSDTAELLRLVQAHGEYGVAMENLCSILEKKKIPIHPDFFDEIIGLFQVMGFAGEVLMYYKKHLTLMSSPTVGAPDCVYEVLTRTLPGRVWVGGRYIIEEQVRISGDLERQGNELDFRSVNYAKSAQS